MRPFMHTVYIHDMFCFIFIDQLGEEIELQRSECAVCRQQGHAGGKTLHQQNFPVGAG